MRFSLKTLLLFVFVFSACFGAREIYLQAWKSHCNRLAPSLYRHVVNIQKKKARVNYLAFGSSQEGPWTIPPEEMIEKISVDRVVAIPNELEKNAVCFVGIIDWPDWNTVIVDFGTSHNKHEAEGGRHVKFKFVDPRWEVLEDGQWWESGVSADSIKQEFDDTAIEFPDELIE